jgi:hypothetical protein
MYGFPHMQQSLSQPWKVHRRSLKLDGRDHTVLSLRPSDKVRFASNLNHNAWHIITDIGGAQLLGHLCWALSYQKKPGTFILIDEPNLLPNPFDADPSWPIAIANTDLGAPSRQALRQLKALLPLRTPSEGTVKLASFGLAKETGAPDWGMARYRADERALADLVGVCCFAATGQVLQDWARSMLRLDVSSRWMMTDYVDIAGWAGEIQIFRNFYEMVQKTLVVRRATFPGRDRCLLDPDERETIYRIRNAQDQLRWKRP